MSATSALEKLQALFKVTELADIEKEKNKELAGEVSFLSWLNTFLEDYELAGEDPRKIICSPTSLQYIKRACQRETGVETNWKEPQAPDFIGSIWGIRLYCDVDAKGISIETEPFVEKEDA